MAEDDFFKKYEAEMAKVRGGDGLTDAQRRIYYETIKAIQTGTRVPLTPEEFEIFKKASKVIDEQSKKENNPKNIVVNIRPGVPLKVKLENGQIDNNCKMVFYQGLLHLGLVYLQNSQGKEIAVAIKDLAGLNDLDAISSNPENVMEYHGFRILDNIKVKATGEAYWIHQFVNDNGEVKIQAQLSDGNFENNLEYKLFSINEIEKQEKIPEYNRREMIKDFAIKAGIGFGIISGMNAFKGIIDKTRSDNSGNKKGKTLK